MVSRAGNTTVDWIVRNWWLSVPLGLLGPIVFGVWLSYGLATPAFRRVRRAFDHAPAETVPVEDAALTPAPVPAALHDVTYRYTGADDDALHGVSLEIAPAELVAIAGPNGSGKSTLARIIAGRWSPTSGRVERPGPVGLGRDHGTAMVFQRPESQVLGVRVADDIVWGLVDPKRVDVHAALARVGLEDLAERETSTLSGGELQRLAVAAALVRDPQLLVSDESTVMIDAEGRAAVVQLLRELAHDGVGVVHVTHAPNEADAADRTVFLDTGRVVTARARPDRGGPVAFDAPPQPPGEPVLELRRVGHVYARGTPWATRALADVDLTVHQNESLLVVGHNGSGKSTLAWVIAGLVVPSEGEANLRTKEGPVPVCERVGSVGLAFQHARLQLLRPTVLDEVRVAADVTAAHARAALDAVGLDASIDERRIDELSGGQMRRVVLAEVIAARSRAVVLDEPFAGLDLEGRADLEALLTRMRDEHRVALVVVSHDHDLPPALVTRTIELEGGRVVRDERADDVGATA